MFSSTSMETNEKQALELWMKALMDHISSTGNLRAVENAYDHYINTMKENVNGAKAKAILIGNIISETYDIGRRSSKDPLGDLRESLKKMVGL